MLNNELLFEPICEINTRPGKLGCVNIDVDTIATDLDSDLRSIRNVRLADLSWSLSIPRVLKLFECTGIKATFFVIGRHLELPSCVEQVKAIVRSGHEVANHTMNHPKQFALLSKPEIEIEIRECHERLADVTGTLPVGFRAPGYVITPDVLRVLQALGYEYDASLNVSKFYSSVKWIYKHLLLRDKEYLALQDMKGFPKQDRAFRVRALPGCNGYCSLVLFPINIIPLIHYPFVSATLISLGYGVTHLAYKTVRRADVLNFEVHDTEFSSRHDVEGAGLDIPYLTSRYIRIPLEKREEYFKKVFKLFQSDFRLLTFSNIVRVLRYEHSSRER